MKAVVILILGFALIDFILTVFWIYRWQSSKCMRKFKKKIPVKLIEANPLIRHSIEYFGTYPGVIFGYASVLLIQVALAELSSILGYLICIALSWAIGKHVRNNIATTDKEIVKVTKGYNKKLKELEDGK